MSKTKMNGFTRPELLAVLVALMLLATLSLPLLAQHRGLSERALRQ